MQYQLERGNSGTEYRNFMSKSVSVKKPFVIKNSGVYLLLIGILLAAVASFGVLKFMYVSTNSLPVVVAKQRIPPYTTVKPEHLEIIQLPQAAVKETMFSSIEPVVGKYTRTVIPAGYPVSADVILAGNSMSGSLSTILNELEDGSLRAKSFPVDNVGALNGKLSIGDKVDVIGAMKLPLNGMQQPVSQIIATNVPVLDYFDGGITLALNPQQAQDLEFAMIEGTISLQLCGPNADEKASDTTVTTADDFVQRYLKQSGQQDLNQMQ